MVNAADLGITTRAKVAEDVRQHPVSDEHVDMRWVFLRIHPRQLTLPFREADFDVLSEAEIDAQVRLQAQAVRRAIRATDQHV